jgi:hypothetical protein
MATLRICPWQLTALALRLSSALRGEKISTSKRRTTARAVRETVDVEQVCRYRGAVRTVRETRER